MTQTSTRQQTIPYQMALRTSLPADEVLGHVDLDQLPGIAVAERGPHYLLFRPRRRFRYGADLAAGLAIAIVLGLLICTAITPVVLAGLPAAFLPAIPLLLDHQPDLALSAVEDGGSTQVTAHGEASEALAEYLDSYLGGLPSVNGKNHGEPLPGMDD